MRKTAKGNECVFPANTRSGHAEPGSMKRPHIAASKAAGIEPFPLYTLRHMCLTRWAPNMDPWTLAYLAGHRDMAITRRYIHPQQETIRKAMEKAREVQGGHKIVHSADSDENNRTREILLIN